MYRQSLKMALAAAALLNSLPASASRLPAASEEEKRASMAAYFQCFRDEAAKQDDGVSDPLSIGAIIAPMCSREMQATAETLTRGERHEQQLMLEDRLHSHAAQDAGAAVLKLRRERAQASHN